MSGHPALTFVEGESQTLGGFGRNDRFSYQQRFGGPGEVANRVLLESGTASGREPTTVVELSSYLGQFMRERDISLGASDESVFSMRLLHFRRTFVEKMFALHGKVELMKENGRPLGPYARHYYDLFQLAAQPEVLEMLRSAEYAEIKADTELIVNLDEGKRPVMKEAKLVVTIIGAKDVDRLRLLAEKTLKSGFILNSVKTGLHLDLRFEG